MKTTTPTRKTRRRPSRSAARPPSSRKPPNVIAYAVTTHCRFSREKSSDLADRGQRDVDDRDVEDRHEERGADHRERLPAARIELGHAAHPSRFRCSAGTQPGDGAYSGRQCRKWRRPVKHHRRARGLDGGDHLVVALRAARLDERRHARVERELRAVGEREERVAREHRAGRLVAELLRLLDRDPHRVDAAHLAGADADRLAVLREHDRVRADVLADRPREEDVRPAAPRRPSR